MSWLLRCQATATSLQAGQGLDLLDDSTGLNQPSADEEVPAPWALANDWCGRPRPRPEDALCI